MVLIFFVSWIFFVIFVFFVVKWFSLCVLSVLCGENVFFVVFAVILYKG